MAGYGKKMGIGNQGVMKMPKNKVSKNYCPKLMVKGKLKK